MYKKVYNDAIAVGALGSWDKLNDRVIKKLSSRSYDKTMKNLIVSDVIRASHDIWFKHIKGVKIVDNRSRFQTLIFPGTNINIPVSQSSNFTFNNNFVVAESFTEQAIDPATVTDIDEIIRSIAPSGLSQTAGPSGVDTRLVNTTISDPDNINVVNNFNVHNNNDNVVNNDRNVYNNDECVENNPLNNFW